MDNFKKATVLMDGEVLLVQIPYDGIQLPGYLFLPPAEKRVPGGKTPLIIHTSGFDSIREELYYYVASRVTPHGYAVLVFDGPGQGAVLRRDKVHFRPEWEYMIGKVFDHVVNRLVAEHLQAQLDLDRIAIFSASMIKACISCDGFYDMFDITWTRMPSWFINAWVDGWMGTASSTGSPTSSAATSSSSPGNSATRFTLKLPGQEEFLDRLQYATLVTGTANTIYVTPERNAYQIFAKLGHLEDGKKALWVADGPLDSRLQAKIAAIAIKQQRIFAWLAAQFGIRCSGSDK
ncbi:hypothetical protein VTN77DRAFT_1666 [Rasamsonia byssochlamydoides]|uniref:uncharacterized protein n=1 Tax=Rasamsonia byssochlamydoides TaxID=89139 RepID=UPI003743EBE3